MAKSIGGKGATCWKGDGWNDSWWVTRNCTWTINQSNSDLEMSMHHNSTFSEVDARWKVIDNKQQHLHLQFKWRAAGESYFSVDSMEVDLSISQLIQAWNWIELKRHCDEGIARIVHYLNLTLILKNLNQPGCWSVQFRARKLCGHRKPMCQTSVRCVVFSTTVHFTRSVFQTRETVMQFSPTPRWLCQRFSIEFVISLKNASNAEK